MSTIDIKHTTGERLVQLREKFGMSQAQVASTIGVDRTSYAKYEANVNRPTRKLKELSELFNVTSDYIMCLSEFPYNEPFAGQDDGQHIVPDGQIFAIRLRTLLHEHNDLPQSELAKQVGVSHQVVEDWAYCKRMPDYSTLLKLAAYFNVTTDYLLGLSDHPHGEPFAGQSGKNFLDFADQPPAPAGQSGKQSTGGAEGAVSIGVATGFAKTGRQTIQAEPLTPEEEAMIRAYREAPTHIRKIVDTALRSEVAGEEEKQA